MKDDLTPMLSVLPAARHEGDDDPTPGPGAGGGLVIRCLPASAAVRPGYSIHAVTFDPAHPDDPDAILDVSTIADNVETAMRAQMMCHTYAAHPDRYGIGGYEAVILNDHAGNRKLTCRITTRAA